MKIVLLLAVHNNKISDLVSVVPPVVNSLVKHGVVKSHHVVDLSPAMFTDPLCETDHVIRHAATARRRTDPVVLNTTHTQHYRPNKIRHRVFP